MGQMNLWLAMSTEFQFFGTFSAANIKPKTVNYLEIFGETCKSTVQ
jgi:hypothetical protein